jgi:stage II sporulation protein B
VTGAIFGFLVLSMFTDGGLPFQLFGGKKAPVASSAGADAGTGGGTAAAGSGAGAAGAKPDAAAADKTASSGANAASLVAVNLPARSYSFLQNGIFSTQAAAQAQEAELKKKGYASAAESTDKTTVYAGFALQKEDAVSLANRLKADKFDVFVKTLDVPAAPKLKWSGKASAGELSGFFQQGDKLLQMIGALTVLHLGETKPAALETSTLNAVKSTHQTWNAASAPVTSGASEDVAPYLQQMAKGLDTAVVSLDEYNKAPSASLLWSTQSALMQYVLAERSLLTKLAAQ